MQLRSLLVSSVALVSAFSSSLSVSTSSRDLWLSSNSNENGDNGLERLKAVVVGGGPVGLATALTLSNAPHYYDVTLVEQSADTSGYDPTKAYLYLVNPRGQVWTKRFPRVQELLEERGSVNTGMGNFVVVPADPSQPIPEKIPASNGEKSYWISRNTMVGVLETAIQEKEEKRLASQEEYGSVEVFPCKQCLSLTSLNDGRIQVTVSDVRDRQVRFEQSFVADLVVAADGMNSAVRTYLSNPPADAPTDWLTENPRKFRVNAWASAASGLRMKVLQFPPAFVIPPSTKPTNSETIYAIRSVNTGPTNYISLGLLPVKDPTMVRPTNVITRPNHDLLKLKGADETKAWFQKAFPRLDLEALIDHAEWQRFSTALGTTFPKCQYCAGMQVTHPSGNTGVVLVGDAIHAFPTDIGQGINAGLADVESLDRALRGKNIITGEDLDRRPQNLAQALQTYERVRMPEIKSLIRLARFGSPYQYRQPCYRDRVGRILWSANAALRLLLNKMSGGKIPPAAIMMAMDRTKSYRHLMRQCDLTSATLWSLLAVFVHRMWGTVTLGTCSSVATGMWFLTYWFGK